MIRENPLFILIKGEIEYSQSDFVAALETADQGYRMPGVRVKDTGLPSPKQSFFSFTEKERCALFLLYAKALAANRKIKEAKAIISTAIGEFAGTKEEVSVLIANSEILILSGELQKAIQLLRGVTSDSAYFELSRQTLADVYLNHLKDRRRFAKCYQEIIINQPN